jgi:hypothetical protein
MIDDDAVTTQELSEELIFLIATATTDAQRKRATDLFRRYARRIDADAYRRGRDSVMPQSAAPRLSPAPHRDATMAEIAAALQPDDGVSLIPRVTWQEQT